MALSLNLQRIFPLTFSLLPPTVAAALCSEFENSWDFERLHFFPMLVRQKKISHEVTEVADFEYLQDWLQRQDGEVKLQGDHLYLNPSAQILLLTAGAQVLKREPGVYVLWKKKNQVCDRHLNQAEAEFLNRLQEDHLLFRRDLSASELPLLRELIAEKIVFENDPKPFKVVSSGEPSGTSEKF